MASSTLKKNAKGYGYKYTDLAEINSYVEGLNQSYFQEIDNAENGDYIITTILDKDGKEIRKVRGARIVEAPLSGKSNPAQEQGSAITYARRYSLLMAFGLATEDDDAESLSRPKQAQVNYESKLKSAKTLDELRSTFAKMPKPEQTKHLNLCKELSEKFGA